MKNNKSWNEEEIQLLKINYDKGTEYCSTLLNRTIQAIRRKAWILKLTRVYMKASYDVNIITEHVKNSKNLSEILNKLNLRCAGGNFITIQKYIKLYNLDISHFETSIEKNNRAKRKYDKNPELLLCENSQASRGCVKRYLYKNNLKRHICELCGQDENWKGKTISLILDHKNGIYNDHRIENLQIVCPNCNATLDTHCGKNKNK